MANDFHGENGFFFRQGSADPVFRCSQESNRKFLCNKCGHTLIENFDPIVFMELGIECNNCATISTTPLINEDELLSRMVFHFPTSGIIRLDSTVVVSNKLTLCREGQSELHMKKLQPVDYTGPFGFDSSWLEMMTEDYKQLTGADFQLQYKIVKKNIDNGKEKFPFAWAVYHINSILQNVRIDLGNFDNRLALCILFLFNYYVSRWKFHPRFKTIFVGFGEPQKFFHTIGVLTFATMSFDEGSIYGFSLENAEGEGNPDLYIRGLSSDDAIAYLEVKAPRAIQYNGSKIPDAKDVLHALEKITKHSKKQLSNKISILGFFGVTLSGESISIKNAVEILVKERLKNRKNLSAIMYVNIENFYIQQTGDTFQARLEFNRWHALNPNFEGTQIISSP